MERLEPPWDCRQRAAGMRRNGASFAQIAKEMRITRERARQIVLAANREAKAAAEADINAGLARLRTKTRNALLSEHWSRGGVGHPSARTVREWLESGQLKSVPNIGLATIKEVRNWLDGPFANLNRRGFAPHASVSMRGPRNSTRPGPPHVHCRTPDPDPGRNRPACRRA